MTNDPRSTVTPLSETTDETTHVTNEGEQISDNASFVSKAPAAPMPDGQIVEGVPVYDVHGETIGNVAAYDEQGGQLVVRAGWLFDQNTTLPLDAITDRGASGVYLAQSKDELLQQYGTSGTASKATEARATDQTAKADQPHSGVAEPTGMANMPSQTSSGPMEDMSNAPDK